MIRNLAEKVKDPKYHGSLIIGAGRLKNQARKNFVLTIAEHDVLLAARCIIECEKDEEIEDLVIEKAEQFANNFKNSLDAERGILAFSKLGLNDKILEVFKKVNPNKTHKNVVESLVNNDNTSESLDFILLLLNLPKSKNGLKDWAINAFDNNQNLPKNYDKVDFLLSKLVDNNSYTCIKFANFLVQKYKVKDMKLLWDIIKVTLKKDINNGLNLSMSLIKSFEFDRKMHKDVLKEMLLLVINSGNMNRYKLVLKLTEDSQFQNYIDNIDIYEVICNLITSVKSINIEVFEILSHLLNIYNVGSLNIHNIVEKIILEGNKEELILARKLTLANDLINYNEAEFINILSKKYQEKYMSLYKIWIDEIFKRSFSKNELTLYKQLGEVLKSKPIIRTQEIKVRNTINTIQCEVKHIYPSLVFFDILDTNKSCQIYRSEIPPNISKNIFIGQQIKVKITRIDPRGKLTVSLKGVEQ